MTEGQTKIDMDRWMEGQTFLQTWTDDRHIHRHELMDRYIQTWIYGWIDLWIDGGTDIFTNGLMDRQIYRPKIQTWIDGWTDRLTRRYTRGRE